MQTNSAYQHSKWVPISLAASTRSHECHFIVSSGNWKCMWFTKFLVKYSTVKTVCGQIYKFEVAGVYYKLGKHASDQYIVLC